MSAAAIQGASTMFRSEIQNMSIVKGESLEYTMIATQKCTVADLLVIRHPDNDAPERLKKVLSVPIVNAGAGVDSHPTQALLDVFTFAERFGGSLDGKVITFVGDSKNSRTMASFIRLVGLTTKNTRINIVAPEGMKSSEDRINDLKNYHKNIYETTETDEVYSKTDILYVIRPQLEWSKDLNEKEGQQKMMQPYNVDLSTLQKLQSHTLIANALPRNSELSTDLDTHKNSV